MSVIAGLPEGYETRVSLWNNGNVYIIGGVVPSLGNITHYSIRIKADYSEINEGLDEHRAALIYLSVNDCRIYGPYMYRTGGVPLFDSQGREIKYNEIDPLFEVKP